MDFGGDFDESSISRVGLLDRAPLPFGDALEASARDAWIHNPAKEGSDWINLQAANDAGAFQPLSESDFDRLRAGGTINPLQDPSDLNKRYGGLGLKFEKPMTQRGVDLMVGRKREELALSAAISHAPDTAAFKVSNFLTQLAVSAADPLNVAAAFVPVVGEARYALWAERFGKFGARALQGAAEGTVGTAALEPIRLANESAYQGDYGAYDSFLNVAFGGLLGGGLHAGFGALSDFLGRAKFETREAALRTSVAQAADGRPVDVQAVLASDARASGPPGTRYTYSDLALAREDVGASRAAEPNDTSLFDAVRAMGGLRLADEAGNPTYGAGEVRALLRDVKDRLTNNETGRTPDEARAVLAERGWFGREPGADMANTDLNDLYDLLNREARGEKVYHPNSPVHEERAFRQGLDRELTDAGVTRSDDSMDAARKLARYRAERDLTAEEYARSGPPDYEPGADPGAEFDAHAQDAIQRAREGTVAAARGEAPSSAVSPQAAQAARQAVKDGIGDDIEEELAHAMDALKDLEAQGVLDAGEIAQAAAAREGVAASARYEKAAKVAGYCLLLHP